MYARMDGGIITHINDLMKVLSKKHEVSLISQKDFGLINLFKNRFWIDRPGSLKAISKVISNCDVFHIHEMATSSELFLNLIEEDFNMVNTFHIALGPNFYGRIGARLTKFLARLHSKKSKYYIAVGKAVKKIIERYNNKVTVINNGIDTKVFKPEKPERFFKDFTVGYIGRLAPEKNVYNLIKACKDLNLNLVIAGEGLLYNKIKKLESNNLKVFGFYPKPVDFYNGIDIFASPSFIESNISRTVVEAMACGKPVLVSGCGGEEDKIKSSFGKVCKPDIKAIKEGLLELKKLDIIKTGAYARKAAVKYFDVRKMVSETEKVYKKVIKQS